MNILCAILLPIITGALLFVLPKGKGEDAQKDNALCGSRGILHGYAIFFLLLSAALTILAAVNGTEEPLHLFDLTQGMPILFKLDRMGRLFAIVIAIIWVLAALFAYEYLKHEKHNKRYLGFYLLVYGILTGMCFSGNMVTFYLFYELMTLLSMPLVLHTLSRESIMAGLKYMFYSFCGAYMALFGLFMLNKYGNTLTFTEGGVLNMNMVAGHEGLLLVTAFFMILGFSVKAGMFPMHAWLPTAHPVAPAPASAVLSGIIVKAGVLGILRTVFYMFGPEFIRGTWVQTVWIVLTLLTVFMGSMLAYREDVFKKRLAYSTVSQLSYILFGIAILNPVGLTGALLHVVFHAFVKTALFLTAGAIIYKTGKTRVSELTGIGKQMPVIIWSYTLVSLALIGIPPTGGFLSKWYLCIGSLESQIPGFSVIGPAILLISALLTAGYLLPVTVKGFFPGEQFNYDTLENLESKKGMVWMMVPMVILAAVSVIGGMIPGGLLNYIESVVSTLL